MSSLRTRFGIPGIIATVALVFAMTGGAFAAKYLITSTKQISPSVLKKLKGAAGPAGAPGAAGAQGAAGAAGANGEKGATGPTGPTGEKGAKGATGSQGLEGEPWTAGGTLPSGATETGSWAMLAGEKGVAQLSFAIPLAAEVPAANIIVVKEGEGEAGKCTGGTVKNPKADQGFLCVYFGVGEATSVSVQPAHEVVFGLGTSVSGAVFYAEGVKGLLGYASGTWAVTAP